MTIKKANDIITSKNVFTNRGGKHMKKSISVGLEYMKKIIAISILFLLISYILININPFSSAVSQKLDSEN